jgi:hypothetical protein
MSAGKCPTCNNEYKNLGAHRCKAKKEQINTENIHTEVIVDTPTIEKLIVEPQECPTNEDNVKADTKTSTLNERVVNVLNSGKRPIIIHNPDNAYSDINKSEEEKVKQLLKDAPLWTKYKPTGINKFLAEKLNKGKSFAPCVFVSEHDQPRVLYLPYEPEKNRLIIPEKGFYIPSQQAPPFFFHSDYSLELIHTPALKDKFNIPAHVIQSKYNAGLMEGTLKSGKELLDEIKKYKNICYLLGAITLIVLFALLFVAYNDSSNFKAIASQTNNLTVAVRDLRR